MEEKKSEKQLEQIKSCIGKETADVVEICKKLTEIEKNWKNIFTGINSALVDKTILGKCTVEKDGVTIKIFVESKRLITSLMFKEKAVCTAIEKVLGTKVKKIEFTARKK